MDMGANELLIILAIVVILFGAKKIPDLAKGLGQGIKDFKKAVKEDELIKSQTILKRRQKFDIKIAKR